MADKEVNLNSDRLNVHLTKAKAFTLDPDKVNLVAFNRYQITRKEAEEIVDTISETYGVRVAAVMVAGPAKDSMVVLELEKEEPTQSAAGEHVYIPPDEFKARFGK